MSGYNGWKNHSTWHIAMMLGNSERTLRASRRVADKAYYRARFHHMNETRIEGVPYDDWSEADRRGLWASAEALKRWVEEQIETLVDVDYTPRPPIKHKPYEMWKEVYAEQKEVQQQMRFIVRQATISALDECDWNEVAEMFDEKRKDEATHGRDAGPREEATA